jgi:hypothetical protein
MHMQSDATQATALVYVADTRLTIDGASQTSSMTAKVLASSSSPPWEPCRCPQTFRTAKIALNQGKIEKGIRNGSKTYEMRYRFT